MNTTTHPHLLQIDAGRVLAVQESGVPGGAPVVFFHAAPGSRRFDPDPAQTAEAGVRLITVDRPGYGESTPLAGGVAASWSAFAGDLATALRRLGIERARVAGWSNGGIGALAFAAHHPDLVERVAVVAAPAHDDDVPWVGDFRGPLQAMRSAPEQAVDALEPQLAPMAANIDSALAGVSAGPADARVLDEPGPRERLTAMLEEAFRQGTRGIAADIAATSVSPWGFAVDDVTADVALWYGEQDVLVPPPHGRWYESALPHATLHLLPDAGHLVVVAHWRAILDSVR